jgi:hypothetical protein
MIDNKDTNIGFDVLILEVERMFPDINTDDGDVAQEGILISGGGDLKTLGVGVEALKVGCEKMG